MIKPILSVLSLTLLLTSMGPARPVDFTMGTIADSLPPLPPPPPVKNGWIGTFSYVVKLEGSGNKPKPYSYYAKFNRIHTGYVVLDRQVKGAIRVNQPDKNNEQRWESWISNGKKKSWNFVQDSLHEVTVITSDACCRTPHDHYNVTMAGSLKEWKEGLTHNYDLQIDYQTGTFIFSMPLISVEAEYRDTWRIAKDVKAKNNYIRDVDEKGAKEYKTSGVINEMDTLMGSIARGQKEIHFQRKGVINYTDFLWMEPDGKKVFIEPGSNGTVHFSLTLKRIGE